MGGAIRLKISGRLGLAAFGAIGTFMWEPIEHQVALAFFREPYIDLLRRTSPDTPVIIGNVLMGTVLFFFLGLFIRARGKKPVEPE